MRLAWKFRDGGFTAVGRSGSLEILCRTMINAASVAWIAAVSVNGELVHTSEHGSLQKAKRACTKAARRAVLLRPHHNTPAD